MSCGLCKGSENICLVPLEIQETYKIQKARRALSDQEENTGKEGAPWKRNELCMTSSLKTLQKKLLQLPFLMLDFFKALGSPITSISACRATESTQALTLPSEPPPGSLGVGRCGRSRENC